MCQRSRPFPTKKRPKILSIHLFVHAGLLTTGFIVPQRVQRSQTLVKSTDVFSNDTLIACSTAAVGFQYVKPIKKGFALSSPFDRVHAVSHT
jgi:hypothetical protein